MPVYPVSVSNSVSFPACTPDSLNRPKSCFFPLQKLRQIISIVFLFTTSCIFNVCLFSFRNSIFFVFWGVPPEFLLHQSESLRIVHHFSAAFSFRAVKTFRLLSIYLLSILYCNKYCFLLFYILLQYVHMSNIPASIPVPQAIDFLCSASVFFLSFCAFLYSCDSSELFLIIFFYNFIFHHIFILSLLLYFRKRSIILSSRTFII